MSINPSNAGLNANLAAVIAQELSSLAADARTLQAQLGLGDVVRATVLASNGLTDLLEINGLRVAAELPSALVPGQAIAVEVTGFSDARIELRIVPGLEPPHRAADEPRTPAVRAVPTAAGLPPPPDPRTLPAARAAGAPIVARVAGGDPLEARLAAARTAAVRGSATPLPGAPGGRAVPPRPSGAAAPGAQPRPVARPSVLGGNGAGIALSAGSEPLPAARSIPMRAAAPAAEPPSARGAGAYLTAPALVRALGLTPSPATLTAARSALTSPRALPDALAALDRVLAAAADPQTATLHALTAFIARLEPASPVLGAQISAFVGVLDAGRETKLAAFARTAADPAVARPEVAASAAALRTQLGADLKSQLLPLAAGGANASPDAAAPAPQLVAAATAVLTAVTALQVNAAAAPPAPGVMAFDLPLRTGDGAVARARVRIDRDAPGSSAALDGDNFHVGFVLDTPRLGVVAVDVRTVGRRVSLTIATEHERARAAFEASLGGLGARLHSLRYRVVTADAVVAPLPVAAAPVAAPAARDRAQGVDIDA